MSGHHETSTAGAETLKSALNQLRTLGVQISGGFICQDNLWTMNQGTGDCTALAFPGGELSRPVMQPSTEAQLPQQEPCVLFCAPG
jgi:hypothetical protein